MGPKTEQDMGQLAPICELGVNFLGPRVLEVLEPAHQSGSLLRRHKREAALQQIGREYPPYYREAIEQYFKRLATGQENAP